jgi:4-hydroxy-3-methylbut-2-enyl diphosphate reductase
VDHYVYGHGTGHTESRPLWPTCAKPKRILITGGASCPDGIIQQVITRINSFFPAGQLRSIETVLAKLQ